MKITKYLFFFLLILIFPIALYAQDTGELISAKDLLNRFSEEFKANVNDYQATIRWIQDEKVQEGVVKYKNPQKIRIDFSDPAGQVICTNGYELWLFIKNHNVVLHQDLLEKKKVENEDGQMETVINPVLINPVGYDKFLSGYAIEYFESKDPVEYKDGSKVYKLKLWRWVTQKNGFNVIYLTIDTNGYIRRIEGITASFRRIIIEIDDIKPNQNISDLVFEYEPPAHANTVDNFISNQGNN